MKILVKEIKSKSGVLHFRRWRIIETKWFSIYIHGIYKVDKDLHCHSHPWNFWSFILWGSYYEIEESLDNIGEFNLFINSWLSCRYHNKDKYHQLTEPFSGPVYTLVITGKDTENWGYLVDNKHVDYISYRKMKNDNSF